MVSSVLASVAALAAVLLLIVALGRFGRAMPALRLGANHGQTRLTVNAALSLDPKRRLLIVGCDGRESLLLLGPHGDQMIGWLDANGETR